MTRVGMGWLGVAAFVVGLASVASTAAAQADAGVPDAGVPASGPDGGPPDAGPPDRSPDAGPPDRSPDAGPPGDLADGDGAGEDAGEDEGGEHGDEEVGDSLFDLSDEDVLGGGADDGPPEHFEDTPSLGEIVDDERDLEVTGVVVTARAIDEERAPDTGGAVQRLDEELLERFNYDNPDAVLQQVPGAYVRQEDGYGLRPNIGLRGVSSERSSRITLMEDGILFGPAPYAAPAAYYFPVMTRMTGVDVYMGAATVPYGPNTVGGAIDLRNRDIPRDADGALDLALGANFFGRAHGWVGASNDWGGFALEGVYLHSDGFKHIRLAPDADTGFDRGEIVLRGELHGSLPGDAYQRLELRLGFAGESSRETYLGLTDADFAEDPYQRYPASQLGHMSWWRTQLQLRHTLEVGEGFVLRSAAYRHDLDRSWLKVNAMGSLPLPGVPQSRVDLFDVLNEADRGVNALYASVLRGVEDGGLDPTAEDYVLIGTNARYFGATGVQSVGTGRFETGPLSHVIQVGARLHHDAVDRNHTEDAYSTIGGELVRATDESYTTRLTHAESLALSLHAAYTLTLFDRVTLTPGVRAELIWTRFEDLQSGDRQPQQFRAAVLPGASAEWRIIDELAVFAGVMRGFAPVAPGQAPSVQAEDSISYEAGARFTHAPSRTSALLTGFVNDYSNYLQQCSFSSGCANDDIDDQANGGRPLVAGFDVRVGVEPRVGSLRFPLRASYTFTFSEFREDVLDSPSPLFAGATEGDALPYLPQHQVAAQVGLEHDDVGVNVGATYVTEMLEQAGRFGEDGVVHTDAQFLLDATVYLQVFDNLRLYVRGENLTLTQVVAARRPFGARPNRPFQIQGGLRITADR